MEHKICILKLKIIKIKIIKLISIKAWSGFNPSPKSRGSQSQTFSSPQVKRFAKSNFFESTCESKPNHHYVIKFSVNRVFEKEIEVLRSRECHSHLRNDLLYLLHLSDLKKVHYESSYGHFIEKVQHNNNNNVLSMCRFLLNVHIDRTPGN